MANFVPLDAQPASNKNQARRTHIITGAITTRKQTTHRTTTERRSAIFYLIRLLLLLLEERYGRQVLLLRLDDVT